MQHIRTTVIALILAALTLTLLSACGTTSHSENDVSIEKDRNYNPGSWF
jgi:uncharacterized lipoprotein